MELWVQQPGPHGVGRRLHSVGLHGVAALIAGRREQRTAAGQHLRQGLALPTQNLGDRENQDFLVAAHSLALEQGGETGQAMLRLAEILPRRDGELTLTHQWLPDLVQLGLAAGDPRMAAIAAQTCQAEAGAESRPARATAASLRCHGLLESDPDSAHRQRWHITVRSVRQSDLPAALEDLAVVLAGRGYEDDARAAPNEAVSRYEDLQARWDTRRAEARLRIHGIKRGVRGRRGPRAASGWEALTLPVRARRANRSAWSAGLRDARGGRVLVVVLKRVASDWLNYYYVATKD